MYLGEKVVVTPMLFKVSLETCLLVLPFSALLPQLDDLLFLLLPLLALVARPLYRPVPFAFVFLYAFVGARQ